MSFGKLQLLKYGWQEGKGLGKDESGMKDPIKVKLKFDTAGIGHDPSEEFTFHWWDHIYNKNAESLQVDRSKNGVQLKKTDSIIMNTRRYAPSHQQKKLFYGNFVQGKGFDPCKFIQPKQDEESSSDDDVQTSLSPALFGALSDEQLLRMCGGQTAHKGARHGITMKGKLSRLEKQDSEYCDVSSSLIQPQSQVQKEDIKKKRKGKKSHFDVEEIPSNFISEELKDSFRSKKKKKSKHKNIEEQSLESFRKPKKKKSKCLDENEETQSDTLTKDSSNEFCDYSHLTTNDLKSTTQSIQAYDDLSTNESNVSKISKRKKKKRKKFCEETFERVFPEADKIINDVPLKKKKKVK